MRKLSVVWVDDSDAVITVLQRRLFGLLPDASRSYRGSGTVWHDADTGDRLSSSVERWLCNIWTKAKWERRAALEAARTEREKQG